jgi:hypothetical protein
MQLWAIQRINPKSSRLTDLLADFKQKGQVRIPYAENNLYIEFALLDFFDPASNRFAYLLEGISPDWQFINELQTTHPRIRESRRCFLAGVGYSLVGGSTDIRQALVLGAGFHWFIGFVSVAYPQAPICKTPFGTTGR